MTFNDRSLVNKSRQIDLLNTVYFNNIDIYFIQECHLNRWNPHKRFNSFWNIECKDIHIGSKDIHIGSIYIQSNYPRDNLSNGLSKFSVET